MSKEMTMYTRHISMCLTNDYFQVETTFLELVQLASIVNSPCPSCSLTLQIPEQNLFSIVITVSLTRQFITIDSDMQWQ